MAGMSIAVQTSNDPASVLEVAGTFLASDPVQHNLILTLLHTRVDHPEAGRYWMAVEEHRVIGVVFQSPLGQRLYELAAVVDQPAPGLRRRATTEDREFLVETFIAFVIEIGEPAEGSESVVDRRLAAQQL